MPPTQTITKQDIYSQVQEIISSGLTWADLSKDQQTLFANPIILASLGVDSNLEAFNYITAHPNTLFTPSKELNTTVDAALLAQLVDDMNQSTLEEDLKNALPNYSLDQQKLITRLVNESIKKNQAAALLKDQQAQTALKQLKPEVDKLDSKSNPRNKIIQSATAIVRSATASTGFTEAQKETALKSFVSSVLTTDNPTNPEILGLLLATSLTVSNPNYAKTSSAAKAFQQVSQAVRPATDKDYQQNLLTPNPSLIIDTHTNTVIDTTKLPTSKELETKKILESSQQELKEILDQTVHNDLTEFTLPIEEAKQELEKIENNPAALKISHQLSLPEEISNQQVKEIIQDTNRLSPHILQTSSSGGEKAAAITKENPKNTDVSEQAIKLYGLGLRPETLALDSTTLTPRQTYALNQQLNRLNQSNLGKEIFEPLGKAGQAFQTITNKVTGKLPEKIATPLNYALHPVQSVKGYLGRRAGKYLGKKIYKAFAKKVSNKTARLVAKTLLREGVKKGTVTLVKLGLRGAIGAAEVALGATGIGAIVVVAFEAVMFVGKKLVQGIQKVAESLWGEKIKARDLLLLPAAGVMAVGGALTSLGTATVAAASSATGIIIASSVAGIFVYVAALTVAPLISTIAQLEMQPTFQGIGNPGDPDYIPPVPTGPIPPGCPSGWPTRSGYITQGPHTSSTHYGAEAIDVGVGMGTPIYSTHPGRAVAGRNGSYGNYVDVYGICAGINFATRYAHMPVMPFSGEKVVAAGEQIGVVNNTGNSTGSHLHYDIRGGALGDINQFLPKPVMRGCIEYSNCQVDIP
jgi:murein DD-endopeptidase MepM/ murein hydrolase activator NlpD